MRITAIIIIINTTKWRQRRKADHTSINFDLLAKGKKELAARSWWLMLYASNAG